MDKLIRQHQHCLNYDFPYLDKSGMVFCQDDDEVDIDNGNDDDDDDDDDGDDNADSKNTVTRILTIYQLLSDPRDYDLIKLARDADDPSIVHHTQPIFPAVNYMDAYHQDDEEGEENPSSSSKAESSIYNHHKEFARKIMSGEMNNQKTNELKLPFDLKLDDDDDDDDGNDNHYGKKSNSNLEIEKKYGSVDIDFGVFPENAIHTRLYIYWKVHIDDANDDDDDDDDDGDDDDDDDDGDDDDDA